MPLQIKRNSVVKLEGIIARVTFVDHHTQYVRLERGHWKATAFVKELEEPSQEELLAFEQFKK